MTEPLRACATSQATMTGATADSALPPRGNLARRGSAYCLHIVKQPPMAIVNAMQGLFDSTIRAFNAPEPEGEEEFEDLALCAKAYVCRWAADPTSLTESGDEMVAALGYMRFHFHGIGSQTRRDMFGRRCEVLLQWSQVAALASGLPIVGGVIGVVSGVMDVLTGLSIRRASRIDPSASHVTQQRVASARDLHTRIGADKKQVMDMLLAPALGINGLAYGKTPNSGIQNRERVREIQQLSPTASAQVPDPASPSREEKYAQHLAHATGEATNIAATMVIRILDAIDRNETHAQARASANETAALIKIAIGVAGMLLGAATIALVCLGSPGVLPLLLATVGLHLLNHAVSKRTFPTAPADETFIRQIMGLLLDRTSQSALARKRVKAVLREFGMDGRGLQILHFAQKCRDDWETWQSMHRAAGLQPPPDLGTVAEQVVELQVRALFTGASARMAELQRRARTDFLTEPLLPPQLRAALAALSEPLRQAVQQRILDGVEAGIGAHVQS